MAKSQRKHTQWIELYRPDTLDGYLGNEETREKIKEYIAENDIPHLLLAGITGTGKTTLAKILCKTLICDYIYINASDENGIETIREKVKKFASSASFQPLKIIHLDEADYLTINAQKALLNVIEEFALSTRFILTCNYIDRLDDALRGRLTDFKILPESKGEIAKHVTLNILDVEGVKYELVDVAKVINHYYPNVRAIIKNLQKHTVKGSLIIKELDLLYTNAILNELIKPSSKSWYNIRQIVADENLNEFQTIYRFLFDNLDKYSKGQDANISIIIDDFMWRSGVVPDKEINMAAFAAKLLEVIRS